MNKTGSAAESTLAKRDIHEEWRDNYRTPENEQFYEMAFSFIAEAFDAQPGSTVMDAGCGSCAKSRHLVDQGFRVLGTDLSDEALDMARDAIAGTPYEKSIDLRQENLTRISLEDNSQDYIVCWGVLMHIPDVSDAVKEISRILAPGGRLAISEGNMRSLQSSTIRFLKKLLRKERAEVNRVPAGVENWEDTPDGRLMTRQADMDWLIAEFKKHGVDLLDRRAGQFSELYWLVPTQFLKRFIHAVNSFWFRRIRWPGPAFGNILIFKKKKR